MPAIKVSGPLAYCAKAWVTSNMDVADTVVGGVDRGLFSGKEWIPCASLPTVILTRPPKPSFGCFATDRPN